MTDKRIDPRRHKGSITRKKGSRKLYIDFRYFGHRIEQATGDEDTPENREFWRGWLDRKLRLIEEGTFRFSKAFPNASEEKKAAFAALEGINYSPAPQNVTFGGYAEKWLEEILENFDSETKKRDSKADLTYWILPRFGNVPFSKITAKSIKQWVLSELRWQKGKNEGKPLSKSRIRNIMIPFREIWEDACVEYGWTLPAPFTVLKRILPKGRKQHPQVYRFDEFNDLLNAFSPHYRRLAEVFVLTGLSASELAGIKRDAVDDDCVHIRYKITRKEQGDKLKNEYRIRKVPLTHRLKKLVNEALSETSGEHVFTMEDGRIFDAETFRRRWRSASRQGGVTYRKPYTTRHTFAAWALVLGVDPNRLVHLMGHGSKSMIFEVYGSYVEGLEKDREKIRNFFGEDFC